jgi:hypothetical protein
MTNFKKVVKTSKQPAFNREDGFEKTWGESREENPGKNTIGEKWEELLKTSDDYWQRTTEKYEEFAKKPTEEEKYPLSETPLMMRSGILEFRNNRNFLNAEYWEEFFDGTLMKKVVTDNGYGLKNMKAIGQRLDISKIEGIEKVTDENNYFKCFKDDKGNEYLSLKELIEMSEGYLSW